MGSTEVSGRKARAILLAALLVEGTLFGIYFFWSWWRFEKISFTISTPQILWGVLYALPFLLVNAVVFGPLARLRALRSCREFRDKIILPLVVELDNGTALIVSLCAGIGEETFFRGVLQYECGIFVSALAFAVLHFGPGIRTYPLVASFYFFYGLCFSAIVVSSAGLASAIVAHALYDFVVIVVLRQRALNQQRTCSV